MNKEKTKIIILYYDHAHRTGILQLVVHCENGSCYDIIIMIIIVIIININIGIIMRTSPREILRCIGRWVIIICSKRTLGIASFYRSQTTATGSKNFGIEYEYEKIIKITR